jgi:inosine/xanthosine triphosphate pyrophosphatase family protein/dephospho-CoA kinase
LQARLVFERAGLTLHHFRSHKEPYSEDYSLSKEELLARAIREISRTVGAASLFFVEDTSLRIEALSTSDDYPGLAVKEWFQETTFESLDELLRARGSNRRATVKADIALQVPGMSRPVYFHGRTSGRIADTEPQFAENQQYPWLTPKTFNGWLIPEGSGKRLGEMALEESWRFDFRIQALESLLTRLEEYAAILNLGNQAYRVRPSARLVSEPSLFPEPTSGLVFIVVGHTCAGKTTFAEYAQGNHGLSFIEASSVMRMLASEMHINCSNSFEAAKELLSQYGADIVARRILDLYSAQLQDGAVISGFRAIEELEVIRERLPQAKVVLIEASERIRFQRYINRDREESLTDFNGFRRIDADQGSFGLVRIAQDFADIRIVNEGSLDDYFGSVESVITKPDQRHAAGVSDSIRPRIPNNDNQLFRCLVALDSAGRPLACDEIQQRTTIDGQPVRHNNANKVLKRVPALARRLDAEGTRVRYEITNAGRSYLRYLQRYIEDSR